MARQAAIWSYDHTWTKLWWPDYAALWYFAAVRKARELVQQHGCDTLVSSSHPFTGHIVALRIKREHPEVPWVVDIGDPFCFAVEAPCNNQALYRRLNLRADRRVFDAADAIAVTNTVTQRIYAELFPQAAARIEVIPPLVRGDSREAGAERVFADDGRVRLVFVGRLYAGIRSPQRLLAMFGRLLETPIGEKVDLHFFGWVAGCEACFAPYREFLGKRIFLHGLVDHATARQAMSEADFLVNLGNATTYQLPSKLVEYTRTGRPILNFAGSPEDSSALFLRDYPAAKSLFSQEGTDQERQWSELLAFLAQPPRLDQAQLRLWNQPFETENIAGRYQSLGEAAHRRVQPQQDAAAKPVVLTLCDYYLPGCKAGGPIRTLASMVERLSQRVRFRVVTRDRDLQDAEPYVDCPANAWRPMGEAEVMHLSPQARSARSVRRILNDTPHDVLYLNSFLSPRFTILPLALRKLGLVARRPVVLAPRGELAAGALRLGAVKKRVYLAAARMLGFYTDVIWQAASASEEQDILAWFPGARVRVALGIAAVAVFAGRLEIALMALSLAGALGGFFLYNRPTARIYLGDGGSTVIGLALALLAQQASMIRPATANLTVMGLLLFVPLLDTGLAVVRRSLKRKAIFAGDRGHMHHQLQKRGFNAWGIMAALGGLSLVSSGAASWTVQCGRGLWAWLALTAVTAVLVALRLVAREECRLLLANLSQLASVLRQTTARPFPAGRLRIFNAPSDETAEETFPLSGAAAKPAVSHRRAA